MSKLAWVALCGLVAVAACTSNTRTNSGASAGASTSERSTSSATTAPAGREDMRNSKDEAPGAQGDRQKPAPAGAPRSTY
jgi:hypothetical protein